MRFLKRDKQALKHSFLVSIDELMVEGTSKWQPSKLSITLSRRKHRVSTEPKAWEPTLRNPYRGIIVWSQPTELEFTATLYQNSSGAFEKKNWYITVSDHNAKGRIVKICTATIDLSLHVLTKEAFIEKLPLVCTKKLIEGSMTFSIRCLASLNLPSKAFHQVSVQAEALPSTIDDTPHQASDQGTDHKLDPKEHLPPDAPGDTLDYTLDIDQQPNHSEIVCVSLSPNHSSSPVGVENGPSTDASNLREPIAGSSAVVTEHLSPPVTDDVPQVFVQSKWMQQEDSPMMKSYESPEIPTSLIRFTNATRSARMRKFKFYQFRRIHEDTEATEKFFKSESSFRNDSIQSESVIEPREEVIRGKVTMKGASCVVDEMQNLEQELKKVETQADSIKSQLMSVAESFKQGQSLDQKQEEDQKELLEKWCALVNQKNDLVRRQMQLNILEKEESLEKTFEQLDKEVRSLMSMDESKKTDAQKEREKYLLDELVTLVNRRDELVNYLHEQEKAIEDDNALKERVKSVHLGSDENCCIQ